MWVYLKIKSTFLPFVYVLINMYLCLFRANKNFCYVFHLFLEPFKSKLTPVLYSWSYFVSKGVDIWQSNKTPPWDTYIPYWGPEIWVPLYFQFSYLLLCTMEGSRSRPNSVPLCGIFAWNFMLLSCPGPALAVARFGKWTVEGISLLLPLCLSN